jgi:hypothetical protein
MTKTPTTIEYLVLVIGKEWFADRIKLFPDCRENGGPGSFRASRIEIQKIEDRETASGQGADISPQGVSPRR